ncbi:UNVERIFIED_CONTAM: hypothetical protein FKN15_006343 [Acipenser sinensis]
MRLSQSNPNPITACSVYKVIPGTGRAALYLAVCRCDLQQRYRGAAAYLQG